MLLSKSPLVVMGRRLHSMFLAEASEATGLGVSIDRHLIVISLDTQLGMLQLGDLACTCAICTQVIEMAVNFRSGPRPDLRGFLAKLRPNLKRSWRRPPRP